MADPSCTCPLSCRPSGPSARSRSYTATTSGTDTPLYIGSAWDAFDPSGTRAASANVFTSDDVTATALLNTPVR